MTLDALKDRLPSCVELISEDLGPPRGRGRWKAWRCPFHDDHNPSLGATERGWRCFACGESGDAISWLRKYRGLSWREILERYSEPATVKPGPRPRPGPRPKPKPPAPHKPKPKARAPTSPSWAEIALRVAEECHRILTRSSEAEEARDYLWSRGLLEKTWRAFTLGFNPEPRTVGGFRIPAGITIPCLLPGGGIAYLKVRQLRGEPKYLQVRGGSSRLYGLHLLKRKKAVAILESELDACLLWQQCGDLLDVVALGGVSQNPREDLLELIHAERWLVVFDRDSAGSKQALSWCSQIPFATPVWTPTGKDPTEAMQKGVFLRRWILSYLPKDTVPEVPDPDTSDPAR